VQARGLTRAEEGLSRSAAEIEQAFAKLEQAIAAAEGKRGLTPSTRPLSTIRAKLEAMVKQSAKVGLQTRPELAEALRTVSPDGRRQERHMNVAQLVAQFGPGVVDTLLALAAPKEAEKR
jgi:hypothetical protein